MSERFCTVGELSLCYETFGAPEDPPLLLVMGLGTQMIAWREDFCRGLVERGFHVIRFDNRDIGRSSRVVGRAPSVAELALGRWVVAAYTLADMAADAAGLLDHLGIEAAHVVGASMGGMIAQTLAARRPERVRSLVSIMSHTGSRRTGQPSARVLPTFLRRPPTERDAMVAHIIRLFGMIGSTGFERDPDELRQIIESSLDRDDEPAGTGRQLAAIMASGNRTAELRRITAPTLVIHGAEDRLISPSGGRATARAIPGARLKLIPGMGHDLPRGAWPAVIDGIVETAQRADSSAAARSLA